MARLGGLRQEGEGRGMTDLAIFLGLKSQKCGAQAGTRTMSTNTYTDGGPAGEGADLIDTVALNALQSDDPAVGSC